MPQSVLTASRGRICHLCQVTLKVWYVPYLSFLEQKRKLIQWCSIFSKLRKLVLSQKAWSPWSSGYLNTCTKNLQQSTWQLPICHYMKCSGLLSAPALFQANVKHQRTMFWRLEMLEWQRRHLIVRLCDLDQANVLFQILSSITKEEDCAQACEEFNLCTNYTFLGPKNPLRWVNAKNGQL